MKHPVITTSVLVTAINLSAWPAQAADTPDNAELWQIIQQQQQEIEMLKRQQQTTDRKAADADVKAEAAVAAVEESAASGGSAFERTSIGGYGELHYNNVEGDDDEIDLHRFVLFLGHEFSDDIRLFTELEVEHGIASHEDDDPGEVEVEQAYVEFDLNDSLQAKGGVFLLPIGILNETHEPGTFYGVERNDVESIIIPATWWAGGAALGGRTQAGFSWDLAVHEGLQIPTAGEDGFRVRSGRQKSGEAVANDLAATGRIRYSGVPGLELAASVNYQSDASQTGNDGLEEALLFEAHAVYTQGPLGLRALYAEWNIDGSAVTAAGADEQKGWYIEPSYRLRADTGVYARYEDLEGYRTSDRFDQWEVGINFWPHEDVVLKADYRDRELDNGGDFTAFDLGIGYQF